MVALLVFAVIGTAVGMTLMASLNGQRGSLEYQQATAIAEQVMETDRGDGYAAVALATNDLSTAVASGDTTILTGCTGLTGSYFFLPDGLAHCEQLVVGGSLALHPTASDWPSRFSVEQYVTWVDEKTQGGTGQNLKRVTVHVTWSDHGATRSYDAMTMMSNIQKAPTTVRGVNVSSGNPATATAQVPTSGSVTAVVANEITNTGSGTDTFNVQVSPPVGWTGPVTLYQDSNNDDSPNAYGDSTASQLADSNGDGVVDTGPLACDPSQNDLCTATSGTGSKNVLVAIQVPAGTAVGTYQFTVTATSVAAGAASQSVIDTVTVAATPVTMLLYLHNSTTQPATASSAQLNMPMDTNLPSGSYGPSSVPDFSTGSPNSVGRYQAVSTKGAAESSAMSDWLYGLWDSDYTFSGTATGTLYAQGCSGTSVFDVYLGIAKSGTDSSFANIASSGNVTVTGSGCTGTGATATPFSIPLPSGGLTVGVNEVVELKVVAVSSGSDAPLVLDYDGTGVESSLSLPAVAT